MVVLTSGGQDPPRLRIVSDLDRYAAAALLGACTAAAVGFWTPTVTGCD